MCKDSKGKLSLIIFLIILVPVFIFILYKFGEVTEENKRNPYISYSIISDNSIKLTIDNRINDLIKIDIDRICLNNVSMDIESKYKEIYAEANKKFDLIIPTKENIKDGDIKLFYETEKVFGVKVKN